MRYTKKIAILAITTLTLSQIALAAETTTGATSTNTVSSVSLEVKNAPKLVSKTSNSITLEWEKVEAAETYIVKYGKESVATSSLPNPQYEDETDPVTTTGATIEKLTPDTYYYISIIAVAKDGQESETFSDELKVKTEAGASSSTGTASVATSTGATPTNTATSTGATPTNTAATFALNSANAQDNKTISLEFSAPLSTEQVTLKITKTTDNSDVPVSSVKQDPAVPTRAIVTIATLLDPKTVYSVTIIKATDISGNNIKQGTDGIKDFMTADTLPGSLEAAPTTGVTTSMSGANASLSGTQTNRTTMSGSNSSGALNPTNASSLPATGTKENLIVLIALLLSFGIVYIYRRKTAK